jgi:hypothetical protein
MAAATNAHTTARSAIRTRLAQHKTATTASTQVSWLTNIKSGKTGKLNTYDATATHSNPKILPIDTTHKAQHGACTCNLNQGPMDSFSHINPLRDKV